MLGMGNREFDVVVFGATGFVGKLTAQYLAEHAPAGTKIALAGRNETKLAATRAELPAAAHDWPLIIADSDSPASLDALAARTQVICTTVGPYLRYGEALVASAASAGTDYVDLTGEVPFVRRSIDKHHDTAISSGARIVHACGFDSIPSDLGTYVLHKQIAADGAGDLTDTTMILTKFSGGISGGTVDSMRVIADLAADKDERKVLINPDALTGGPQQSAPRIKQPSDISSVRASTVDPSLRGRLAPFFMASYNTRIVRRSNALLNDAYGKHFRYGEAMKVGDNPVTSVLAAGAVQVGMGAFFGAMAIKPLRPLIDRMLPKPGEGPSEKARDKGFFITETYTRTSTGKRYRSRIKAAGDPGYKATAVMLGESALSLALERGKLPKLTGVLTPAAAMGDVLLERLRAAGLEISVAQLG